MNHLLVYSFKKLFGLPEIILFWDIDEQFPVMYTVLKYTFLQSCIWKLGMYPQQYMRTKRYSKYMKSFGGCQGTRTWILHTTEIFTCIIIIWCTPGTHRTILEQWNNSRKTLLKNYMAMYELPLTWWNHGVLSIIRTIFLTT